jgi:hypothetical protein
MMAYDCWGVPIKGKTQCDIIPLLIDTVNRLRDLHYQECAVQQSWRFRAAGIG